MMHLCDMSSHTVFCKKCQICTSKNTENTVGVEERMKGWLLMIALPPGRGEMGMLVPTSACS